MNQLLGNALGGASPLPQLGGFGNAGGSPLSNLLAGGLQCSQNEQRLLAEKSQRNILRKYLTQATGDPIQSAFISRTIPGKGYGDTLDVGLGTKNSIMQSLGITQPAQNTGLLSSSTFPFTCKSIKSSRHQRSIILRLECLSTVPAKRVSPLSFFNDFSDMIGWSELAR